MRRKVTRLSLTALALAVCPMAPADVPPGAIYSDTFEPGARGHNLAGDDGDYSDHGDPIETGGVDFSGADLGQFRFDSGGLAVPAELGNNNISALVPIPQGAGVITVSVDIHPLTGYTTDADATGFIGLLLTRGAFQNFFSDGSYRVGFNTATPKVAGAFFRSEQNGNHQTTVEYGSLVGVDGHPIAIDPDAFNTLTVEFDLVADTLRVFINGAEADADWDGDGSGTKLENLSEMTHVGITTVPGVAVNGTVGVGMYDDFSIAIPESVGIPEPSRLNLFVLGVLAWFSRSKHRLSSSSAARAGALSVTAHTPPFRRYGHAT